MIHALVFALALLMITLRAAAWAEESHPPDVTTETDLMLACKPPPRPAEWLQMTKREALKGRSGLCCEWDHRIPRSLGGADDLSNLQLQRCDRWERDGTILRCVAGPAYKKDLDERRKHNQVCLSHSLPLKNGQQWFRDHPGEGILP